jgi:hypothetical protein
VPEVLDDLVHLPLGSHCVAFHVGREEAADHAVAFLAGAPRDQPAMYWVPDEGRKTEYAARLREESPDHVGCVSVLDHEQVEMVDGRLRPVGEVRSFVGAHPTGVTAAGETLSKYLGIDNVPDHLEYEGWFDQLERENSRFLCPYDLRAIPPGQAPEVMRSLGAHHSHVVLSNSLEPAIRLLQLFVFSTQADVPAELGPNLRWALKGALIQTSNDLVLTPKGEQVIANWSETATVDW